MVAKKSFFSSAICLGMLAATVLLGACGGGGSASGPLLPTAAATKLVGVTTELGTVTVDVSSCGDIDLEAVAWNFNRDLDKPCQKRMGIRNLDATGLLLECQRDWRYIGQYFPPQRIVFAREQALRHERDHWAARELGISCWSEVDHTVDFCCQPL